MKPEKIEQLSEDVLTISWDDGHQSIYFTNALRAVCPCAVCNEKRTDVNPLKILQSDPDHLSLIGWNFIGRYAISFKWNDGHDTGIYTYSFLRELCQCDECSKKE